MLKKTCSLILCVVVALSVCGAAFSSLASDYIYYTLDHVIYRLSTTYSTATVFGSDEELSGVVVIPNRVTYENVEYRVKGIEENAFSGRSEITSITLAEELYHIDGFAFENCISLREVYLPESMLQCASTAFDGCSDVTLYAYKGFTVTMLSGTTNLNIVYLDEDENADESLNFFQRIREVILEWLKKFFAAFGVDINV